MRDAEAGLDDQFSLTDSGGAAEEFERRQLRAALEQVLGDLTPAQQAAWRALTGEPFAGPLPTEGSRFNAP